MLRANVEGSAQVLRAAAAAGVERVVHTSSAATIGEAVDTVGREDSPHRGTFLSVYELSKFLAERKVLALGAELGVPVVCVNPSSVQGPGRTEGSARLFLDLVRRRRPPVVDTWLSVVDVDDCAAGHLRAEASGVPGERYLLSGASLTTAEAIDLLRDVCGRPAHTLRLSRGAVRAAGVVASAIGRITRRQLPLCPGGRAHAPARTSIRRVARRTRAGPAVPRSGRDGAAHARLVRRRRAPAGDARTRNRRVGWTHVSRRDPW